ncbi:uncharacterized protein N7459_004808 [Penicillium hispanicum]|uniref:uncharacterized protein n=1 Tax=Penicillium hispanicum TaxID=1080232 RepID=UPI002540F9BF|nr:uncharacterized protein N7459_004808 [Penicillium hispanicum]KAJ5585008.1 hypothetical protein N7459_004808 [Penicillium hispanicum]
MELKPWYPRDFKLALSNTFSEDDLSLLLQQPGSSPRFVYGVLMLPSVLKYYIDAEPGSQIHQSMTPATLFGYQLHRFSECSTPVIARSSNPQAAVEGMLIFSLDEKQRNAIYELEGGLMCLANVQVEICQKDAAQVHTLRIVDAGAFTWTDPRVALVPIRSTSWSFDHFLKGPFYQYMTDSQRRSSSKLLRSSETNHPSTGARRSAGPVAQDHESHLYCLKEDSGSVF